MATLNLSNPALTIDSSRDSIVIIKALECSPLGGRVLNVEGYDQQAIMAGHVIIRDTQGAKEYKPMPVNREGTAYASLPENHTIVGVAYASMPTRKPSCTIVVRGSVNEVASPYPLTEEIKKALPLIVFTQD